MLHLICDCSLGSFDPEGPVVKNLLVVKSLNCSTSIINIFEEDISESLRVVCVWVLDDLDIPNGAIFGEYSLQVILIDSPRDASYVDVVP